MHGSNGGSRSRRALALTAVMALCCVAFTPQPRVVAQDEEPAAEVVVFDRWYASFHNGKKAGWSHRRRVRTSQDGVPVLVTKSESSAFLIGGDPESGRMVGSQRIVEDGGGRVLSYRTSMDMGMASGPQTREGTLEGDVIHALEDGNKRDVPYPEEALGPAAVDRVVHANLKPGTTGEIVQFRPIDATGEVVAWKVEGMTETVNVLGHYMWLTRVERTGSDGMPQVALVGPGAREYAGTSMLGVWSWFLTEELVAKQDAEPASLVSGRVLAVDRATSMSPKPVRRRWRLSRESGPVGELPQGVGQTIVARGAGGSLDIEVTFTEPPSGTALPRPYAGATDMARFLAATPMVELANERLQRISKMVVGELINSIRSARMVELCVKQYVHPSPANVGFGTACDTISSRTGDSTEAAALAIGFARAAGLPARFVSGFVYWEPKMWPGDRYPNGAFAPHAWAEIYVADGVWLPIDPMRMDGTEPQMSVDELEGHGGFDATHIAVLRSDLDTATPFTDVVWPTLLFMDGLRIEVVDVE